MKKTLIILGMLILGLTISGVANAVTIGAAPPSEEDLYLIFYNLTNTLYTDSNDPAFVARQIQPATWSAGNWRVNVLVKFAGNSQTIGFESPAGSNNNTDLGSIGPGSGTNGYYAPLALDFSASNPFRWYDFTGGTHVYSDNLSQFVAFQLSTGPGGEIEFLNGEWETSKDIDGLVYLIAFEDDSDGDDDFNDLIAIVEQLPDTVVPEPATMLLLGSGLIGLAGFARRRFKK